MLALALLACSGAPAPDSAPPPDPSFTLAVFPDVQFYTLGYPDVLDQMVDWVAAESELQGVAFAVQEGDLTHNNSAEEWVNAEGAFRRLDDVVPYALCVGNHDMGEGGDTSGYNGAFPLARQSALPGFGGSMDETMDNAYHLFTAGGVDWMVLSLIYDPPDDVLAWAEGVVADHPTRRVIVLTHAFLLPSGQRSDIGRSIWQTLKPYGNVTMVLNGHYIDGEAAHTIGENDAGAPVPQIFSNYQTLPVGGQGRLRLMEIRTDVGEIQVQTYAPPYDVWVTDAANDFLLEGLELGPL